MGIWGPQSSQNDDAADWLNEFEEQPSLPRLKKPIVRAFHAKVATYLEVTDGGEAIIAADVLAQLLGYPGKPPALSKSVTAGATGLLQKCSTADLKQLAKQAVLAVKRIFKGPNSELQQMWEEKGKSAWIKTVQDLVARLKRIDSAAIARVLKPTPPAAEKRKSTSKRQPYKVGLVVAIPLPGRRFAYAKVFNGFDLGVYNFLSAKLEPLEKVVKHKFLYFNSVTDRAIKRGVFLVIGEQPFPNEKSAWAPPMASGVFPGDDDMDTLMIKHKGDMQYATPRQAAGMDIRTFSGRPELFVEEIVDRLVKGNNRKYRLKK